VTGEALLAVRGVVVNFGPVQALGGVDFELQAGESVALAGENGAGKSTLIRCIAGDRSPNAGQILIADRRVGADPAVIGRLGVAVVWQDLSLCDNLDVASNLLLGSEGGRLLVSETRFHTRAARLLRDLGITLPDTTRNVRMLSGGQRQLLAVARAMRDQPRLLILDEPTASLGGEASAQVEALIAELHRRGTSILMAGHDIDQMLRLCDRIVVLHRGRLVADVEAAVTHPDDIVTLISGQQVDSSPRRQLSRLHVLTDRLASADPSSSLPLILSALSAALGSPPLSIHLLEGATLRAGAFQGFSRGLQDAWAELPYGPAGGPVGLAALSRETVVDPDVRTSSRWASCRQAALEGGVGSSWAVPVMGPDGVAGVITILRPGVGYPDEDELELVTLYAGYAGAAVERDQLLGQVTARNRVLETIREVLETLAGPVPFSRGLVVALEALRDGLTADEVALITQGPGEVTPTVRAGVSCPEPAGRSGPEALRPSGGSGLPAPADPATSPEGVPPRISGRLRQIADEELARAAVSEAAVSGTPVSGTPVSEAAVSRAPVSGNPASGAAADGRARLRPAPEGGWWMIVTFATPEGATALVAGWNQRSSPPGDQALMEDAANSLRLALEREESQRAQQEAAALRRSRELQRGFLSRLSHELRTPLTAIRGYASSLMQPDVTWDGESEMRFLSRMAVESARLGRLVEDLLDFSAIESGVMRLQPDWCDLALVLDAAVAVLPPEGATRIKITTATELPVVWADHDRLEQVFVNLLDNALRHNPPGTEVRVSARVGGPSEVIVEVTDDGIGVPDDLAGSLFDQTGRRRGPTSGAGLGLSITKGIVDAHGGRIEFDRLESGSRFRVRLPTEADRPRAGSPSTLRAEPPMTGPGPEAAPAGGQPVA
jgi:signal transduction histidine kinase/ABC-type multidrug transport system ATPase subunit